METLITAGGYFNIGLLLFHLSFWHLFNWGEELKQVSSLNRAVMQVLNISLSFVFAIFAYISLMHTPELISTPLGKSLVLLIALFWLARSLQQVVFFKLHHRASWAFLALFLTGFTLYAIPAISML